MESRLSRSGVKETTLDYAKDFAERRGMAEQFGVSSEIRLDVTEGQDHDSRARVVDSTRTAQDWSLRERAADAERTPSPADPGRNHEDDIAGSRSFRVEESAHRSSPAKRSMFAGLKLKAFGSPEKSSKLTEEPNRDRARQNPDKDRFAERVRPLSNFEQAVDQYARAFNAANKQLGQRLPLLDVQRQSLQAAGQQLDQVKPGSQELIQSALQHDDRTAAAMIELSGRERVGQLVAGIERERSALANTDVRADRFVQRWQELQAERRELQGWQNNEARGKVEDQMRGMAKGLERDPSVDAALRNRAQELGISHVGKDHNIAREMERQIGQGRSQSRGIER